MRMIRRYTSCIAIIPVDLIDEKQFNDTFLIYPLAVSITRYWSSTKSLTGMMDVILSPSDKDNIWDSDRYQQRPKVSDEIKKWYNWKLPELMVFQQLCEYIQEFYMHE